MKVLYGILYRKELYKKTLSHKVVKTMIVNAPKKISLEVFVKRLSRLIRVKPCQGWGGYHDFDVCVLREDKL